MKNLYIILIALLMVSGATGQTGQPCSSCLPEGIIFTMQAQIDNFQANYPGCTEIEGDVIINEGTFMHITNLNGLNVLTSIGGDLSIKDNTALTSLTGLENLDSIGCDLYIDCNTALTSLTGLEGITSIGGSLQISGEYGYGNPALTSLTGLEGITSIGGSLQIGGIYGYGNPALTSLTGLENLTSIGGDLWISNNISLTSLSELNNIEIESIGDLYITCNDSLSTCNEQIICDYLASPNGSVNIYKNTTGCNNPIEVANACGITLQCLPFGNYYFLSQADIDNFQSAFPNCTELQGNITISGSGITNLLGLDSLTSIGGYLDIGGNSALTSLTGLGNLTSIGGYFIIVGNSALTSLTGLENLTSIGGFLQVGDFYNPNPALTSLTGLENLTSIGSYLDIGGNSALTSLTGLDSLTSIGGYFNIKYNNALTSLTGPEGLTSIGGQLEIIGNYALTSLVGLDSVDAGSITELYVINNSSLSTCDIQSICNYLASPGGFITFYNNATGCNSQEEVLAECESGLDDNTSGTSLFIFPNPASEKFTLSFSLADPAQVTLEVLNQLGQVVETILDESLSQGEHQVTWNAERLPSGIYFYRLTAGDQSSSGKMVVVR